MPMNIIDRLALSKFRNSFHLSNKDIIYLENNGFNKIRDHAYDFINKRLKPEKIINDGKQTPTHGHPVFIAQHATATCCRGCLAKWHNIKNDHELSSQEVDYIVKIIMTWITNEYKKNKNTL